MVLTTTTTRSSAAPASSSTGATTTATTNPKSSSPKPPASSRPSSSSSWAKDVTDTAPTATTTTTSPPSPPDAPPPNSKNNNPNNPNTNTNTTNTPPPPPPLPPKTTKIQSVVVIGAGISGLAAALELQARGYQVLVLEARSRPGGRLKTSHCCCGVSTATTTTTTTTGSPSQPNKNSSKADAAVVVPLDLGGALIHGIVDNPLYDLVHRQLQLDCIPIVVSSPPQDSCLLLTDTGWPVDPHRDERVAKQFNQCLEAATRLSQDILLLQNPQQQHFNNHNNNNNSNKAIATGNGVQSTAMVESRVAETATTTTTTAKAAIIPSLESTTRMNSTTTTATTTATMSTKNNQDSEEKIPADRVHSESSSNNNHNHYTNSTTFGTCWDQVCAERRVPTKADRALFQWYRRNLELSCGASFDQLGLLWNEDEPYGYDGDHVAIPGSWSTVVETLAGHLVQPIHCQAVVRRIQIVEPPTSSPTTTTQKSSPSLTTPPMRTRRRASREAAAAATTTTMHPPPVAATTTTATATESHHESSRVGTTTTVVKSKTSDSSTGGNTTVHESTAAATTTTTTTAAPPLVVPSTTPRVLPPKKNKVRRTAATAGSPRVLPERWSRRLRGAPVETARRSLRTPTGVDWYTPPIPDETMRNTNRGTATKSSNCSNNSPLRHSKRPRQMTTTFDSPSHSHDNNNEPGKNTVTTADAAAPERQLRQPALECWPSLTHPVVQVTLDSGQVLQADAVVCTVPLGVLKRSPHDDEPGGSMTFDPPLPRRQQQAIQRLGTGLLNKCALTFAVQFWPDSDFLGLADDQRSYLVLNASKLNNTLSRNSKDTTGTETPPPACLLFLFGGDFAKTVEDWTDAEIVADCLLVLQRMCGKVVNVNCGQLLLDYHVTRWGRELYSHMSFTYVPPGVDGFAELQELSRPVCSTTTGVPLLMFAGEHTTPYHPSTIHGAFLSGIREAYRLDCLMEPAANDFLEFSDADIYQPTFHVRRRRQQQQPGRASSPKPAAAVSRRQPATSISSGEYRQHRQRGAAGVMTLRHEIKTVLPTVVPAAAAASSPSRKKTAATTPVTSPARRSQRSTTARWPGSVAATTAAVTTFSKPATETTTTSAAAVDLRALQDRTLLRSLESYGPDYDYLASTVMPVYTDPFHPQYQEGVAASWSPAQIEQRCWQLLRNNKNKRRRSSSSSEAWKAWLAPRVAPPSDSPVASAVATTENGKNSSSSRKQGQQCQSM